MKWAQKRWRWSKPRAIILLDFQEVARIYAALEVALEYPEDLTLALGNGNLAEVLRGRREGETDLASAIELAEDQVAVGTLAEAFGAIAEALAQ